MSTKFPVFPISQSQHFSDYGFDPQIDYFQVLEAAKKHKMETSISMDALSFKLQKPISRDEHFKKIKKNSNKKRWWKNALLFFKSKWADGGGGTSAGNHCGRPIRGGSMSGPIYITESRSGSSTPYRKTSRPTSGPIAGTLTPAEKNEVQIPYISLRDFEMDDDEDDDGGDYYRKQRRVSTSSMPIYLVT